MRLLKLDAITKSYEIRFCVLVMYRCGFSIFIFILFLFLLKSTLFLNYKNELLTIV